MLSLLTFIIGMVGIFLIARYNKSNKLFWSLVISMMAGFVGGSIAANMKSDKKVNVENVSQNMTSCNMPIAQFMVPTNNEEIVPSVETRTVVYNTAVEKPLRKTLNTTFLYHDGLVPFIFDSS